MNMNKFIDYKPEQIAKKLKDVEKYESTMGVDMRSQAWRKWCTDANYRKREWQFRQSSVALFKHNNKIL
jgi:hypothetical protein